LAPPRAALPRHGAPAARRGGLSMTTYQDKLREHSFDGIQEFDNYLPRWWLWTFYLACIFAAIYWLYYHGFGFGMSPEAHYRAARQRQLEVEVAQKPVTAEMLLEITKQDAMV